MGRDRGGELRGGSSRYRGGVGIPRARAVTVGEIRVGPPPRHVPWAVRVRLALGGHGALGWWTIVVALGLVLFGLGDRWHHDAHAIGEVVAATPTGETDEDSVPIADLVVRFVPAGAATGAVTIEVTSPAVGGRVAIVYASGDPGDAARWDASERPIAVTGGAGAAGGLVLAVLGVLRMRRAVRLLRSGREVGGRLIARRASRMEDGPVELTFAYVVEGRTFEHRARTHAPRVLEDDAAEPMLYDPAVPSRATTLDDLPGGPRVVEGALVARSGIAAAIGHCIAPAVAIGELVALAILLARIA